MSATLGRRPGASDRTVRWYASTRPRSRPFGARDDDGVLALLLRRAERSVRLAEERVGLAHVRERGDADGHARRDPFLLHARGRADALGGRARRFETGLGLEDHELVAAVAGDDVGRAHVRADRPRQAAQMLVAGLVAEPVVHQLQGIAVDEDERELVSVAHRARDLLLEARVEIARVEEAGELVGDGETRRLLERVGTRERGPRVRRDDLDLLDMALVEVPDARVQDVERAVHVPFAAQRDAEQGPETGERGAGRHTAALRQVLEEDRLAGPMHVVRVRVRLVRWVRGQALGVEVDRRGQPEELIVAAPPDEPRLCTGDPHRPVDRGVEYLREGRDLRKALADVAEDRELLEALPLVAVRACCGDRERGLVRQGASQTEVVLGVAADAHLHGPDDAKELVLDRERYEDPRLLAERHARDRARVRILRYVIDEHRLPRLRDPAGHPLTQLDGLNALAVVLRVERRIERERGTDELLARLVPEEDRDRVRCRDLHERRDDRVQRPFEVERDRAARDVGEGLQLGDVLPAGGVCPGVHDGERDELRERGQLLLVGRAERAYLRALDGENSDKVVADGERHADLGPRAFDDADVARVARDVADVQHLALLGAGAGEPFAQRRREAPRLRRVRAGPVDGRGAQDRAVAQEKVPRAVAVVVAEQLHGGANERGLVLGDEQLAGRADEERDASLHPPGW